MPAAADSTIEIVGAGPAGLAAAITAARGGARVVVHERAQRVGSRFHGDFQGLENWTTAGDVLDEVRALGIAADFLAAPRRQQVCFGPGGEAYDVASPDPFYYLVQRGPEGASIERSLLRQALAAGVDVHFGSTVRTLPRGGVYAGGPRVAEVIAAGHLFETDLPDGAWAALGEQLAPAGYAYLLVHGGRGTLSVCLFRAFQGVKACLARAVAFFERRIGLTMREARPFGGVGNAAMPATAVAGGVLLAGEAAGFQDPLWGFGIRHALLSGQLAARALLAGRPGDYDRLWRQRLGGTMRASTVLRFFYSHIGDRGYRVFLRTLSSAPDPRAWLRRRYSASRWKRVLYPLVRQRALPLGAAARARTARVGVAVPRPAG